MVGLLHRYYCTITLADVQLNSCDTIEGKGTDVTADIVTPTTWSLIDSPVRINPSCERLLYR